MLLQLRPFARLRGEDEVEHVTRDEAEFAVVVVGRAPPVAAGNWLVAVRRRRFADDGGQLRAGIGTVEEKCALDRVFEAAFGNSHGHATSSRTSILPVTAAEMIAERNSSKVSIAFAMAALGSWLETTT
jgi:hypothetical protein